jgi:hypothetical protein
MSTTAPAQQAIPLVCNLAAIPAGERQAHELLAKQLFYDPALERHELDDGYAFQFRADQYPQLAAFIANERRCCPFFRFTLEVEPEQGPIWLRLTGGEGVKELLLSELVNQAS